MSNYLRGSNKKGSVRDKPAMDTPARPFRCGFAGLIGKPNVGKSTILNYFLGKKVSITSPRPQTTRHRILGILNNQEAQVIFVDSPGWHRPKHTLGKHLVRVAKDVIEEADILVAVVDVTSGITEEDEWVFEQVRQAERPALLAINKIDLVSKGLALPLIDRCAKLKLFDEHIPVSALTADNMDVLLGLIVSKLPVGPSLYEPTQLTDQPTEQFVQELIREQVLHATRQEVPHATAVLLEEMAPRAELVLIRATILVEREGQKAILIGRGGQMLKRIGRSARVELERWLGRKVFLELFVKVEKAWRDDPSMLRQLGYD